MALYSDFNISFERDPLSNDIQLITEEQAVSQSIKNLVLTYFYERPFQPSIGSTVSRLLFEPLNNVTTQLLAQSIKSVVDQFEPRAVIKFVDIYTNVGPNQEKLDPHTIIVDVGFFVYNTPNFVTTTISLRRVR